MSRDSKVGGGGGWNYRVFRTKEGFFEIREVYYNEEGVPDGYVGEPSEPFGETFRELGRDLEMMKEALSRPILGEEDFT